MPYNLIPPSLFHPFLLWNDLAAYATEMLASSGQVIGSRVQEIARPIRSHENVSGETAPAVGAPGALARRSGRARTHSAARH
jgi:hypothetical protein